MATKTPAKGKKAGSKKEAPHKKGATAKAAKPAPPVDEEREDAGDGDDEDDDDDEELEAAPKAAAKKPAGGAKPGQPGGDPPAVVPARRLTPEAKAKVNEMVKKGMPLGEALKMAASWETFVAPVKDEPAKLVQGKSFEGARRPRRPVEDDEGSGGSPDLDADEEPAGTLDTADE
jgi:hypothetical protein